MSLAVAAYAGANLLTTTSHMRRKGLVLTSGDSFPNAHAARHALRSQQRQSGASLPRDLQQFDEKHRDDAARPVHPTLPPEGVTALAMQLITDDPFKAAIDWMKLRNTMKPAEATGGWAEHQEPTQTGQPLTSQQQTQSDFAWPVASNPVSSPRNAVAAPLTSISPSDSAAASFFTPYSVTSSSPSSGASPSPTSAVPLARASRPSAAAAWSPSPSVRHSPPRSSEPTNFFDSIWQATPEAHNASVSQPAAATEAPRYISMAERRRRWRESQQQHPAQQSQPQERRTTVPVVSASSSSGEQPIILRTRRNAYGDEVAIEARPPRLLLA